MINYTDLLNLLPKIGAEDKPVKVLIGEEEFTVKSVTVTDTVNFELE